MRQRTSDAVLKSEYRKPDMSHWRLQQKRSLRSEDHLTFTITDHEPAAVGTASAFRAIELPICVGCAKPYIAVSDISDTTIASPVC